MSDRVAAAAKGTSVSPIQAYSEAGATYKSAREVAMRLIEKEHESWLGLAELADRVHQELGSAQRELLITAVCDLIDDGLLRENSKGDVSTRGAASSRVS